MTCLVSGNTVVTECRCKNDVVVEVTLSACKRMLSFEALSFGLKVPEENGDEEGMHALESGKQQEMDFGVCVGSGATVVCR